MSEFFKQLIAQLSSIWQKLSIQQKIISSSLIAFTILGLAGLMLWARSTPPVSGFRTLYSDLELAEASQITEKLKEGNYKYEVHHDGRAIAVPTKHLYEIRMMLAREGLPKSHGVGFEIFDKTNLAMTDFVQKINARRALEGELQRTIEGLEEVKAVRVHIAVPEPSIFLDDKQEAKASVVVRTVPGRELTKDQIRGITHLVSSSVEGLKPDLISVIDYGGRLLSNPFGSDETALASSRNLELQQKMEQYLERNAEVMLIGVLGPNKAKAKITADLDFDRVERTMEKYDPESRVIRSEERTDENTKNAPDGDHQKERSLTNYEIDKTIEHLVRETGNIKRLTISVAVDGKYETGADKKETYLARSAEELRDLEDMVKNAVGYDVARGDQIVVTNLQFDNEFLRRQQDEMRRQEMIDLWTMVAKYAGAFILALAVILVLRSMARAVAEAMNPPVPQLEPLGQPEPLPVEVPESMRRSNELLERVELITKEAPVNIASIIREWLREPRAQVKKKN